MADSADPLHADATPDLIRVRWETKCFSSGTSHKEAVARGRAINDADPHSGRRTCFASFCPELQNISYYNIDNALIKHKPSFENYVPTTSPSYGAIIAAGEKIVSIQSVNEKRKVGSTQFWNVKKEQENQLSLPAAQTNSGGDNTPAEPTLFGDQDPPPANLAGDAAAASQNGISNVKKEEEDPIDLTRSPSPIRRNDLPAGRNDVKAESLVAAKKGAEDGEEEEEEDNVDIALQTFSKKYLTKCKEHEALKQDYEALKKKHNVVRSDNEELRKQSASKSKARDEEVESLRKKMAMIEAEKQKADETNIRLQADVTQLKEEYNAVRSDNEELRKQSASKSKARDEEVERLRKKMETIVAEKQKLDEACISLQAEIMQLTRF